MDDATFSSEAAERLRDDLMTRDLSRGVGNAEEHCSVAAINLALTGELTDKIPLCMSDVLGRWIIAIQDALPANLRNSWEWKELLPLAAGTGRAHEKERLDLIMSWMWEKALPALQPQADLHGYGTEWLRMTTERTVDAAYAANAAAAAAAYAASYAASYVAAADAGAARAAARAVARAAHAAGAVARAVARAAAAHDAAAHAADAAAHAAAAANAAYAAIVPEKFWTEDVDVFGTFRHLVKMS